MGVEDPWSSLAKQHGRRSVMSLQITEEQLEAETNRQIPVLCKMVADQLRGDERTALDFGCGAGRFSHALAQTIKGRVTAFDSCVELVSMATWWSDVDYHACPADKFFDELTHNGVVFDVVMAFVVLGSPGLDLEKTASALTRVLADDGLLIVVDHMPDELPVARWWRFRPEGLYTDLFRRNGVELSRVGALMQLDNEITVLCGRRR